MAATAKIDTLQDLVHALDEHPEWVDELRVRLLTRELLELPQKLADFIAATEKRFAAVEARLDRIEIRLDRTETRLDRIEDGQTRIRNDLGLLKGGHARNVAERQAGLIVEDLGLEYVRTLAFDDIRSLVRAHDTSDLPANDLRSFRLADLILEATDPQGASCYVAVEISFTVNGRDSRRALRNAEYLSRFTGRRAFAIVAGVHVDDRIRDRIDAGEVFWYQLDQHSLETA